MVSPECEAKTVSASSSMRRLLRARQPQGSPHHSIRPIKHQAAYRDIPYPLWGGRGARPANGSGPGRSSRCPGRTCCPPRASGKGASSNRRLGKLHGPQKTGCNGQGAVWRQSPGGRPERGSKKATGFHRVRSCTGWLGRSGTTHGVAFCDRQLRGEGNAGLALTILDTAGREAKGRGPKEMFPHRFQLRSKCRLVKLTCQ
jgi:hypothetical protein